MILIVIIVSISFVVGYFQWISSKSEVIPPNDYNGTKKETVPPLSSHQQAIDLADEYLKNKLGYEFFNEHIKLIDINERHDIPNVWIVNYKYIYDEYTTELSVAINSGSISKDKSRVDSEFSRIILQPQKILISEQEAKTIAQKNGLKPSYEVSLSCEIEFHRICWRIVKKDVEIGDLNGVLIDAENGVILKKWTKGFGVEE